jgi:hypothetical protein
MHETVKKNTTVYAADGYILISFFAHSWFISTGTFIEFHLLWNS